MAVHSNFASHEYAVSFIGVAAHYWCELLDWRDVISPGSIVAGN